MWRLGVGFALGLATSVGVVTFYPKITTLIHLKSESLSPIYCAFDACPQNPPLFKLKNNSYYWSDLPSDTKESLQEISIQNASFAKQILEETAARIILSQNSGKNSDSMPTLGELMGTNNVSNKEAKDFFQKYKQSFPVGAQFDAIKQQIKQVIANQKTLAQKNSKLDLVKADGSFQFLLKNTGLEVQKIDSGIGILSKGSKLEQAKVNLVEITDYQCGRCSYSNIETDNLMRNHVNDVKFTRVVASTTPNIFTDELAKAAYCTFQVSEAVFWNFDGRAFIAAKFDLESENREKLNADIRNHILKLAKDSGVVDESLFLSCLSSPKAIEFMTNQKTYAKAAIYGKAPAYIVNQKRVFWGPEKLKQNISDEIEVAGGSADVNLKKE